MIFSYSLVYTIAKIMGWEVSFFLLLIIAAAHMGLLHGVKKITEKKFPVKFLAGILIAIVAALCVFKLPPYSYLRNFIFYLWEWRGMGMLKFQYGWLLLYVLLAVCKVIYDRVKKNNAVRIFLVLALAAAMIWQTVEGKEFHVVPVLAMLWELLCAFTEGYQRVVLKRESTRVKDMLPFFVGVMLFVCVLPNGIEPISWQPVKTAYKQVKSGIEEVIWNIAEWGEKADFGVDMMGYSDDDQNFWGRLSGARARDMLHLSIYGRYGGNEHYFAGIYRDDYSDNTWWTPEGEKIAEFAVEENSDGMNNVYQYSVMNSESGSESESQMILKERLHNLYQSGLQATADEDFSRLLSYKVEYWNLDTDTIFLPTGCYDLRLDSKEKGVGNQGDNIRFLEQQKKRDSYKISALQMNLQNEKLVNYLRSVTGEKSENAENVSQNTLFSQCIDKMNPDPEVIEEITSEEFAERLSDREKKIRKKDLVLPPEITGRTYELAEELTRDYDNDYDKAQAIIHYLKDSGDYSYTISPEPLKEGAEVTDQFLFESKFGYCTYFATAAAVLCRCAGIPARYVEGFHVSYGEEINGVYGVSGNDAHAWVQVYLHGFGWIDLDATPGYKTTTGGWKKVAGYSAAKTENHGSPYDTIADPKSESENITNEDGEDSNPFAAIAIMLVTFLAGGMAVIVVWMITGRIRYLRSVPNVRAEICMKKIFGHLKKCGFERMQTETLRMYGVRIDESGKFKLNYPQIFFWYEKVRYGNKQVSEDEMVWLEELCRKTKEEKPRNIKKV